MAAVGTGLWIMEVCLIVKKLINIRRESLGRKTSTDHRNFYEYLPKPEVRKYHKSEVRTGLNLKAELDPRNYSEPEIRSDKEHMMEPDVKNYPEDEHEESSRTNIRNYNKSLSQQETGKCKELEIRDYTKPEVRIFNTFLPELTFPNYKESLFEPEVMSYKESLFEPEVISYKESLFEPEVINYKESLFEPEVINYKESLFEPEVVSYKESLFKPEVVSYKESLFEPEVISYKESLFEPEVISCKESLYEPKVINYKESLSEPEVLKYNGSPTESEIINNNDYGSQPKVTNFNGSQSEPKVVTYNKTRPIKENDHEEKSNNNRTLNRLSILVLILAGILEDFPNVIVVYHTSVMPLCGSTTKQNIGSGVTVANIISSMLNSLWTMICLFFELCKCTKRDPKNKQELHINLEDTDRNNSEQSRKIQIPKSRGCFQKPSKTCAKEACKITGKIIVCMVIFITFSATFGFGFMTLSHVLGFIDLTFTYAGPLNLSTHVITSYYGPGLDAKPDEAMFIYLHYKLPDWHYITLNDSRHTKSASFRHIINRLYLGQFDELSHLRDGTLIKVIPCSRAMPFLQNPEEQMDHVNCKIIFTLRYFPINLTGNRFITSYMIITNL